MTLDKLTPDEWNRAVKICDNYPWYEQVLNWYNQGCVSRREIADGVMWLENDK